VNRYESSGRYNKAHQTAVPLFWQNDIPRLDGFEKTVLPYGKGRSYGDVCLNDGGILLDTSHLNRFLNFNETTGVLCCEAGVTLSEILKVFVPRGWFLPVTPGTQFVTVGGAIANDVHGKNHHQVGTFGCHVLKFELLRSNGERSICSLKENPDLFRATIGGLGLTGLILWAEFRMRHIPGSSIEMETVRFENLDEFFTLSDESEKKYEFSVSWVDCLSKGRSLGRGLFMRGNFAESSNCSTPDLSIRIPVDAPGFLMNPLTVRIFNELYYRKQRSKIAKKKVHYQKFFYPLDAVLEWNRIYGREGFFQYQCAVPFIKNDPPIRDIFERIAASGMGSFLAVLKTCGDIASPGLMSFPRKGVTLALDFPNHGNRILELLESLDSVVRSCGGAVNPAKDARVSPESFSHFYPQWKTFLKYIDPKFSSSFWRRVTA
jgi:FAD/FMN-containing dehydrogenase